MKYLQNTPHLDPLPSSDEGRGNPASSVKHTLVCVSERSARFPLPLGRGEDQGEGLLWTTFVSSTKWKCSPKKRAGVRGKRSDNFTRLRMKRNLMVVVLVVALLSRVSAVLAAGIDSEGVQFFE